MEWPDVHVGDIVKKVSGADLGEIGLVLLVETNPLGNSFVTVLPLGMNRVERSWYANLVEIISEGN